MSLYGMMRTGVSGMNAQANRLSTVADNIANSSTYGYKRSSTAFSTLMIPNTPGAYNSGGVTTSVRYSIAQQGVLQYTSSVTDLAVNGEGFFVVQDASGSPFLTRAGSFVPDAEGRLVNAAGFYLLGYSYANGEPSAVTNGFGGLEPVTVEANGLTATASTFADFVANLPSTADPVTAASLPSTNGFGSEFTAKSSMIAYDSLGGEVLLDIYFTKTAANTWEVAIYNKADAAPDVSFPYASGPLSTTTLSFDPTNGQLTGASADSITVAVPGGESMEIDLSGMTQLANDYEVFDSEANGNPPSSIDQITVSNDGIVYAQFENGSFRPLYKLALATAQSPDQLRVLPGNVFSQSDQSGDVRIGFANSGGLGAVASGALEQSNVDIATELTDMIESQRSYTANSKVFQTGSELMDVLVNLKR